jgi:arylsulfatase A-like enzyme
MRLSHLRWLQTAVAILTLGTGCSEQGNPNAAGETVRADGSWPNVVLISIDTLRPDHLGCYRYERDTSPNIDQLAADGALFETAVSSTSWTLPAHCAMFTGLSDTVHGCVEMDRRLADSRVTLAERLKAAGYATVGFFSGPALHPVFGLGQGFDNYVDCTSYANLTVKVADAGQPLDGGVVESESNADITSPRVYQQVHAWLQQNQRRPFFMFVHMWDVHFDFIPPPPYDRKFDPDYQGTVTGEGFFIDPSINPAMPARDLEHIIALYDGEIGWTDEHVGKILADLDKLKLRDKTVVMLLSDHGEEFFEHGRKGHRQTLYDEVIRIPLIVRYPGHVPAGLRVRRQARMIDVAPTLLDLVGMPAPTNVMGHSLVPLFSGGELSGDTLAVSELFSVGRELRSFRRLDSKMIYNEQTKGASFFSLLEDPRERNPLTQTGNPTVSRLSADARQALERLESFRHALPAETLPPKLTENVRRQLESLGYLKAGGESSRGTP